MDHFLDQSVIRSAQNSEEWPNVKEAYLALWLQNDPASCIIQSTELLKLFYQKHCLLSLRFYSQRG